MSYTIPGEEQDRLIPIKEKKRPKLVFNFRFSLFCYTPLPPVFRLNGCKFTMHITYLFALHPFDLTTVFLCLFVIADTNEKQVAFVVVQRLTIVFFLYLLQGTSRTFVMF